MAGKQLLVQDRAHIMRHVHACLTMYESHMARMSPIPGTTPGAKGGG